MDLSIVFGGRDDNYGETFIERLEKALDYNIKLLDESGLDYEIIAVDYNPIDEKYLHENDLLKSYLNNERVKNIIVDNTVIVEENLCSTTYYEYFAKNAGIRVSTGDLIFVTNSDILLTKNLIKEIKKELNNDSKDDYFYRVRYRGDILLDQEPSDNPEIIPNGNLLTGHLDGWGDPEQVLDLYENLKQHGLHQQDPVLGLWSGDASMFSRSVMFNDATAYNESEYGHRTNKNQSNMDSEILWNLYKRGKQLKLLEAPYYHLYHGISRDRENHWSKIKYKNNDNWGYVDYNKVDINSNTVLIYGKDASIEYE